MKVDITAYHVSLQRIAFILLFIVPFMPWAGVFITHVFVIAEWNCVSFDHVKFVDKIHVDGITKAVLSQIITNIAFRQ